VSTFLNLGREFLKKRLLADYRTCLKFSNRGGLGGTSKAVDVVNELPEIDMPT